MGVEERRLQGEGGPDDQEGEGEGEGEGDMPSASNMGDPFSDLATDMNATTSTSSDGVVGPGPMDDMDMASNVTASEDTSEDEVTDGPPNSPTGTSASASSSEDTTAASASSADCASITDTVCAMEGVTKFCELLKSDSDLEAILNDESEEFTLFAPTDAAIAKISTAFEQLSDEEAGRVIMFHIYELYLTYDQLGCGEKIISMTENGDASRTKCSDDNKYQNGNGNTKTGTMPEIASADTLACNGVIHTIDDVMFPVSLSQLEADSSESSSDSDDSLSSGDMSNTTSTTGASPSEDDNNSSSANSENSLTAASPEFLSVPDTSSNTLVNMTASKSCDDGLC